MSNPPPKADESDFKIEQSWNVLNLITTHIGNCDTKASIMIGVFGILLTLLFTSQGAAVVYALIEKSIQDKKYLFVVAFSIATIAFAIGLLMLLRVLYARTPCSKKDSKVYFADIACNSSAEEYIKKCILHGRSSVHEDICRQIYINSKICTRKYRLYNIGCFISFLMVPVLIVIVEVGMHL